MSSSSYSFYHVFALMIIAADITLGAQITGLRVPSTALAGDDVTLHCDYDEIGTRLYSLKWYKDGIEFYRHIPSSHLDTLDKCAPNTLVSGIDTKCWESSERKIILGGVVRASSGNYTCEVIGDHPHFKKTSKSAVLQVYSQPLETPIIEGVENYYRELDLITLNCTSFNSEYHPGLTWYINDQMAKVTEVLQGWNRLTVGLSFIAEPDKFLKGVITVRCQAQVGQHVKTDEVYLYNQHLQAQQYHLGGATGCVADAFLMLSLIIFNLIGLLCFSLQ